MFSHRFLIVAVAGLFSGAHGDTIYVDDDNCPGPGSGTEGDPYCSIQTAIDNAVDTDEIVVAPGTYFETIDFIGKAVTLRSSAGPELTIIDAQRGGTVVTCTSFEGSDTVLDGFTIRNGTGTLIEVSPPGQFFEVGGGMWNHFSSPTVTNCTFSRQLGGTTGGGAMYNHGGDPTVTNCTFSATRTGDPGGGGAMFNGKPSATRR